MVKQNNMRHIIKNEFVKNTNKNASGMADLGMLIKSGMRMCVKNTQKHKMINTLNVHDCQKAKPLDNKNTNYL